MKVFQPDCFKPSPRGLQPVHFISKALSDPKTRYSQTEKDALAVTWAKERFKMYLLGAPRFQIITAHKPLLPLFNKATSKLPPRIEKWVMDMQDVDFELIYEPGKDEADPLDFLSRHLIPETSKKADSAETSLIKKIETEHAVVLDRIKQEAKQDNQMKKLSERILEGDWEVNKKDPDIEPFYQIKEELCMVSGLIFRQEKIIIPQSLQRKVVKAGHSMGHLGITKTKQMLRDKYWFPRMNILIEEIIGQWYE